MALSCNISNAWKTVKTVYVNVNGTWKTVGQISVNVNGTWRNIWSYSWSIGGWGSCSKSCGTGTQTRTVTCKRNDGQTVADSFCTKYVSAKPATSQNCNTQACVTCMWDQSNYYIAERYNRRGQFEHNAFVWAGNRFVDNSPTYYSSYSWAGHTFYRGTLQREVGGSTYTGKEYQICRQ